MKELIFNIITTFFPVAEQWDVDRICVLDAPPIRRDNTTYWMEHETYGFVYLDKEAYDAIAYGPVSPEDPAHTIVLRKYRFSWGTIFRLDPDQPESGYGQCWRCEI